ncbi:hypothetical protein C8A00DRAFT_35146 [Chaetomidium leptoderma]|uniref:Uncharacterized protein n=1 Tax=Chaetomidium leptoderma TaxID=669021 RepID=A0AAN6VIH3_9PEZI|nr:hypothetical protein C8A00DRAFT_35146 [Chaetomidium leptoderma]
MTQRLPDAEGRQSDRDSSNQDGTSGCDSPPAYESLEIMTSAATPTPQKSTSGPEGNDRAPVQHALLYTWSNCEVGQGWGALVFEMALNPRHHSGYSGLPWAAGLVVKCRDVPRLMREGFFWSAENILPEEGYMSHSTIPAWSNIGFDHERVWSLADKSNGETPLWVAQLEVLSHSVTILSGFQVHNLSRKNVHRAHAWNAEKQLVYRFEYHSPRDCYNCIYDDMPLQGWWPWPREGWTRRDVDVSGPAVEPEDAGDGLPPLPFPASQHEPPQPHQEPSGCVML